MKKLFVFILFLILSRGLFAQDLINNASIDKKYLVKTFLDGNGKSIDQIIVPGKPPDKYRAPVSIPTETAAILNYVPGYDWSFGCSATSAAMISGYYDNHNYINMYNGPTNNGVAPMDNSIWGTVVINGETRSQCPLSATRQGVDGRIIRGHVDDYWIQYGNCDNDPFIQNGWIEHTSGECTGDYMGTNQSDVQNCDGATTFFFYTDGSPLYDFTGEEPTLRDGCHGLRLYFESRGYSIVQNYSQYIYGYDGNTSGFTFNQYKQEIDAGRPVLIQVNGHTMVGYGYDNPNIVYIHDTWDYSSHTMTWGGSYAGLQHYGVGVFQLVPIPNQIPTVSITFPNNGDDFTEPDILVTGNASDPDGSINEVQVRLNSGNWVTASGTDTWTHQVTLAQGSNLIEARAIDNIGAPSGIVPVAVTYTPNSAPTLTWTGEPGYEADGVSPDEGDSTLTFTFRVKYTDADGDAPQTGYPKLYLNKSGNPVTGSPFAMLEGNTEPFTTGRIYTIDKNDLETGSDYTYYFEAKDINNNQATGIATIEKNGPVVIRPAATIILTQPSADIVISQGDSVLIEWNTTNAVSGSNVNLFLDIDSIWTNSNEIPLDLFLPLNGSIYCQTSEVPPGHYFIAGLLLDGIENPHDYASGTVTIIKPITLTQPSANVTIEQGDSITIEWQTTNPAGSSVSLFMDTDNTWWNGNETPIEFFLPLNGSYVLHTADVPTDTYYIAGMVPDGINNPYDYAEGTVTIIKTITLNQPAANITIDQGDSVTIEWQTANPAGSSVSLFMDIDNTWLNGNETPIDFFLPLNGSYVWNTTEVPAGTYYIAGMVPDGIGNPYDYAAGTVTIINTFQLSVSVSNGWNMVSVPGINPDGQGISYWWLNHVGNVFKFIPGAGYSSITTTTPTEGYWMKNLGDQTYNTGDEWPAGGIQFVTHDPIDAVSKWNALGGYEDTVDTAAIVTIPADMIIYPIFKFVPGLGYRPADQIVPGYGYWVKVSAACQIILPEGKSDAVEISNQEIAEFFKDEWGKITLTDAAECSYTLYALNGNSESGVDLNKYELPPLPPEGIFDVRFGSGRAAEDLSSDFQVIEMRGVTYPVKVKVENMDIRLMDVTGKLINTNIKKGEEITITNSNIDKIFVTEQLIPDKYSLEQNYPNPFNPGTTIEFSLPENVKNVKLSIYNILGEKVAELLDGSMQAGKFQYQWNAKDFASGTYIYELRTEKFVSIKKMILLK